MLLTLLNFVFFFFGSQVEILAKDYLSSLTEPKEEPESKESSDTEENDVRLWTFIFFLFDVQQLRDVEGNSGSFAIFVISLLFFFSLGRLNSFPEEADCVSTGLQRKPDAS